MWLESCSYSLNALNIQKLLDVRRKKGKYSNVKELETSNYDSAGQIFPQNCSSLELAWFQDRVVMLLISTYCQFLEV